MTVVLPTANLLLTSESARRLYHDYAADMPILDYHSHLDQRRIASGQPFRNLTELWLNGDHYKWRALRWLGVDERFITGDASDKEKFLVWAKAAPAMAGNPLYHWTHLELSRYFGIEERLTEDNAEAVWSRANERLSEPAFTGAGILDRFKVRAVCTTDDPIDSLADHAAIRDNPAIRAKVAPTFRPDRILDIRRPDFPAYIAELGKTSNTAIESLPELLAAIDSRLDFFHAMGCRLSDHGFGELPYAPAPESGIARILKDALGGRAVSEADAAAYQTWLLLQLGERYQAKGWTMQLHIGAIRNNNDRMSALLGKDSGYDSILDYSLARSLNGVLNALDREDRLPKTIVYSLYPYHHELIATTIGNFQGGGVRGKLQLGSAWWFHDQKEGMIQQLKALSSIGLISAFVGMLTDSRSFMSFPRHEYFRRVLCGLFGTWMEEGELPMDFGYIGEMIRDICYRNAEGYFGLDR